MNNHKESIFYNIETKDYRTSIIFYDNLYRPILIVAPTLEDFVSKRAKLIDSKLRKLKASKNLLTNLDKNL